MYDSVWYLLIVDIRQIGRHHPSSESRVRLVVVDFNVVKAASVDRSGHSLLIDRSLSSAFQDFTGSGLCMAVTESSLLWIYIVLQGAQLLF